MSVLGLVPQTAQLSIEGVLAQQHLGSNLEPFSDTVVDFCAAFARALSISPDTRGFAELQALDA
jgi:hypothetical protein